MKLFKSNSEYIAKFYGHSSDFDYTVMIKEIDDELIMSCICPYLDNCKHEYATLLAIDAGQYKEIKLKLEVESNIYCLVDLIKNIPSDELKEYMIKKAENDLEDLLYDDIMDYFIKYQPKKRENTIIIIFIMKL